MFSTKKHAITLIACGSRPSPFLKAVDDTNYAVNYIFNNSGDFSIEHPDPSKRLSYHLELFDLLGAKDKRLHAYPGQHLDNGPEALASQAVFLKGYL